MGTMQKSLTIIGALSLAAAAAFGLSGYAGHAVENSEPEQAEQTVGLTAQDIFGENASTPVSEPATAISQLALTGDDVLPDQAMAAQAKAEAEAHLSNDPFVIKRILPINGPIKYGEWHWDEDGAPETGELIITVDLEARVISVFRDGYEIGAAAALLGTTDHPTPLGVFPILTKERHNVSEKYGNAPMPWTLRLTWDGVAIHGGSEVENGYASHGCIGVPDPFAAHLFDIARKGDVAIITRGKRVGLGDSLVGG